MYVDEFQSYLYGIEISIYQAFNKGVLSFNRTFMELKLFLKFYIQALILSFNRTFMELKYFSLL